MVCGGCATRRAALKAAKVKFMWTPTSGATDKRGTPLVPVQYDDENVAKAKVMRKGGSYRPVTGE